MADMHVRSDCSIRNQSESLHIENLVEIFQADHQSASANDANRLGLPDQQRAQQLSPVFSLLPDLLIGDPTLAQNCEQRTSPDSLQTEFLQNVARTLESSAPSEQSAANSETAMAALQALIMLGDGEHWNATVLDAASRWLASRGSPEVAGWLEQFQPSGSLPMPRRLGEALVHRMIERLNDRELGSSARNRVEAYHLFESVALLSQFVSGADAARLRDCPLGRFGHTTARFTDRQGRPVGAHPLAIRQAAYFAFLSITQSDNPDVQLAALQGLGRVGSELPWRNNHSGPIVAEQFATTHRNVMQQLCRLASSTSEAVRNEALSVLRNGARRWEEDRRFLLASPQENLRRLGLDYMGNSSGMGTTLDQTAANQLVGMVDSTDAAMRSVALRAIEEAVVRPGTAAAVIESLLSNSNREIQTAVLTGLGRGLGDQFNERTAQRLLELTRDASASIATLARAIIEQRLDQSSSLRRAIVLRADVEPSLQRQALQSLSMRNAHENDRFDNQLVQRLSRMADNDQLRSHAIACLVHGLSLPETDLGAGHAISDTIQRLCSSENCLQEVCSTFNRQNASHSDRAAASSILDAICRSQPEQSRERVVRSLLSSCERVPASSTAGAGSSEPSRESEQWRQQLFIELARIVAGDRTGRSARFLQNLCCQAAGDQAAISRRQAALLALIESARETTDAETRAGRNAASRALRQLVAGVLSDRADHGNTGSPRVVHEICVAARNGSREAQNAVLSLSHMGAGSADGALRNSILRLLVNDYAPHTSQSLRFIAAVANGERILPESATTSEVSVQQYREAISQLGQRLTQELATAQGAAGAGEQSRRDATERANALTDLLIMAAMAIGSQGVEAAHQLCLSTTSADALHAICHGNPRLDSRDSAALRRSIAGRITAVLSRNDREFSPDQVRHLINLWYHFARPIQLSSGRPVVPPYQHRPINSEDAALVAGWSASDSTVRPILSLIASGAAGEEAREALSRNVFAFAFPFEAVPELRRVALATVQNLEAGVRLTLEQSINQSEMGRVAAFAHREASTQERERIINALLSASENQHLSQRARECAYQTIRAIVITDADMGRTESLAVVADRCATNPHALRLILSVACGSAGSVRARQQAQETILSRCQASSSSQSSQLRSVVLRELMTASGQGRLPLLCALLTNSNELLTAAQARRQLLELAGRGHEQALGTVLSSAIGTNRHILNDQHTAASDVAYQAPSREMIWDAVRDLYETARFYRLSIPLAPENSSQAVTPDAQMAPDQGLGNLLREVAERLSGSQWQNAARVMYRIATDSRIPRAFREQAMSHLIRAAGSGDAIDSALAQRRVQLLNILRERENGHASGSPDHFEALATIYAVIDAQGLARLTGAGQISAQRPVVQVVASLSGQVASRGNERAVRALAAMANNNHLSESVRHHAQSALRECAESNQSEVVLRTLRAEARQHDNQAAREVLMMVQQGLTQPEAVEALARQNGISGRDGMRLEAIVESWRQRARGGDRATLEQLARIASGNSSPPEFTALAAGVLREAMESGNNQTRQQIADVIQQCWRSMRSAAGFAILAAVSALLPKRQDLRDDLMSGYRALVNDSANASSGQASVPNQACNAELHVRRNAAALAVIANRQLLTPLMVQVLVTNMTPELANVLPLLSRPSSDMNNNLTQAREWQSMLMRAVEEASRRGGNTDLTSLAQAWQALSRHISPEQVASLDALRGRATTNGERQAISRAALSIITHSSNRAAREAALPVLRETPLWQQLSEQAREVVSDFASQARCQNLSILRQACDTVFGGQCQYPLALQLRQRGLPSSISDWEVCGLASAIGSFEQPGSVRTVEGWALPILSAANLAWQEYAVNRGSSSGRARELAARLQAYGSREQFLQAVAEDLSRGNLAPSRQFLSSYALSFQGRTEQLRTEQREIGAEIARLERDVFSTQRLSQAVQAYQTARADLAELGRPRLGQRPNLEQQRANAERAVEQARHELEMAQRMSTANLQPAHVRLSELRSQIAGAQAQHRQHQLAQQQDEYHQLRAASGRQSEADLLLLRALGRSHPLPAEMQEHLNQLWRRLGRQLMPLDAPPVFTGSPEIRFNSALATLRNIGTTTDLSRVSAENRVLHAAAAQASADISIAEIMRLPAVEQMAEHSQDFALRLNNLMRLFEVASRSPEVRAQLREHLQQQVRELVNTLNSDQMRATIPQFTSLISRLRQERDSNVFLPGSIGRQRLEQTLSTLERYLDIVRPGGTLRSQLDNLATGVENRLNDPALWQQATEQVAQVVVTTAAFAAASALSGLAGPAAPLVWAALTPCLVMAGRHLTQELLHACGVSHQGSPVGDLLFGRTAYDPSIGQYASRHQAQVESSLAREYGHEFLMNLAFAGTGRFFRGVGSEAAGGSFIAGVLRTERHAAPSIIQQFRSEFLRGLGVGVGLGAPDLLGFEGLGTAAGFVLAGWHGFSAGRMQPRHTFHTATRTLNLTESQRTSYAERLNRQLPDRAQRNAYIDALGYAPESVRQALLELANHLPQQVLRAQARIENTQARAEFLLHINDLPASSRTAVVRLFEAIPVQHQSELATVMAQLPNRAMLEHLTHSLRNLSDQAQRNQLISQLQQMHPQMMVAALAVPGMEVGSPLWRTLTEHATTRGFASHYERTLARLPMEQQSALLQILAAVQTPGRAGEVLSSIASSPHGDRLAQSLLLLPDQGTCRCVLESLAQLERSRRAGVMRVLGAAPDVIESASILNSFGHIQNQSLRAQTMERFAQRSESERRLFGQTIAALAPEQAGLLLATLAGSEGTPSLVRMVRETPPEEMRVFLAAGRQADPALLRNFLEQVARLSPYQREQFARLTERWLGTIHGEERAVALRGLVETGFNFMRTIESRGTPAEFNRVYSSAVVETMAQRLRDLTRDWPDLSSHATRARPYFAAEERLNEEIGREVRRLMSTGRSRQDAEHMTRTGAEQGQGQLRQMYDECLHLRARSERAISAIEQRQQAVQQVVNDICQSQGLPPTQIEVVTNLNGAQGQYLHGRGRIRLRLSDLAETGNRGLVESTAAHELVHHEQNVLVVRMLAQRLELPLDRPASSQEWQRLQQEFRRLTNCRLDERFASAALQGRTQLNKDQMRRAHQLGASIARSLANTQEMRQLVNWRSTVDGMYNTLSNNAGLTRQVLALLADRAPSVLRERLSPYLREAIANRAGLAAEDLPAVRRELLSQLRLRLVDIDREYNLRVDRYYSDVHEAEAQQVSSMFESWQSQNQELPRNTPALPVTDNANPVITEQIRRALNNRLNLRDLSEGASNGSSASVSHPAAVDQTVLSRFAELYRRQRGISGPELSRAEYEEYVRLRDQICHSRDERHRPIAGSIARLRRGISLGSHELLADGTAPIPPGGRSGEQTQAIAFNHMHRLMETPLGCLRGRTPRDAGYSLVAVRGGTTVDGIGWDVLLVNTRTGEYVHIDIKEYNPGNRYPEFHNRNGIYGSGTRDETGPRDPASILPRDRVFVRQRFEDILGRLHVEGSPLNVAGIVLPMEPASVLPNYRYADVLANARTTAQRRETTWTEWRNAIEARHCGLEQLEPQLRRLAEQHARAGREDWAEVVNDLLRTTFRRHRGWLLKLQLSVELRDLPTAVRLLNSG